MPSIGSATLEIESGGLLRWRHDDASQDEDCKHAINSLDNQSV